MSSNLCAEASLHGFPFGSVRGTRLWQEERRETRNSRSGLLFLAVGETREARMITACRVL